MFQDIRAGLSVYVANQANSAAYGAVGFFVWLVLAIGIYGLNSDGEFKLRTHLTWMVLPQIIQIAIGYLVAQALTISSIVASRMMLFLNTFTQVSSAAIAWGISDGNFWLVLTVMGVLNSGPIWTHPLVRFTESRNVQQIDIDQAEGFASNRGIFITSLLQGIYVSTILSAVAWGVAKNSTVSMSIGVFYLTLLLAALEVQFLNAGLSLIAVGKQFLDTFFLSVFFAPFFLAALLPIGLGVIFIAPMLVYITTSRQRRVLLGKQ